MPTIANIDSIAKSDNLITLVTPLDVQITDYGDQDIVILVGSTVTSIPKNTQ